MESEFKTDREIRRMALDEWAGIISWLWKAIDKPVEKERLKIYADALWDIPMGLLEAGVKRLLRSHRFSNIPTVGEVIEAVKQELGNPYDMQSGIEEWTAAQPTGVFHGTFIAH